MKIETDEENTTDILQKLSRYYREVLKYVSSSASRVLQNVANGQRYGLVADLCLLVKDPNVLYKQSFKINKPKRKLEIKKFIDEAQDQEEGLEVEESELEELEITDEEVAWSALNKIWRTQENNPYERETLIGHLLVKTSVNRKNFLAPLLISQVEITYDPITSSFNISKLSEKPDLNRSLIASLLPDDDLAPVRSQINELFLEAEDVDMSLIKKIVELLSNHVDSLKDIRIIEKITLLNDIALIEEESFIVNSFVIINTPRIGSFILDDLDVLATLASDISVTPIDDLLTVNFDETEPMEEGADPTSPILQQDVYYFPLKSNIQQQKICDRVMSNKLTVVWGPPGTGKSETISNLVCHLIANGKSVLVTSQQPKALEVVREKLRKNVSLSAPKHPNLTVPLELALIRGEKESAIAEDIRTKLDALGVYTLGVGSYFEIISKLEEIQKALKSNREKSLLLMKRFSELKLLEKDRYLSKKDSPLKLQDLKDYDILDTNESFISDDQTKNAKLLYEFADSVITLGKNRDSFLKTYGSDLDELTKLQNVFEKAIKNVAELINKLTSSTDKEISLSAEILNNSEQVESALVFAKDLQSSWDKLKIIIHELSLKNKAVKTEISRILEVPDSDYETIEKIIKRLKPHEQEIAEFDLSPDIDVDSLNINQIQQELEILKNTKVNLLTKLLDSKAKDSLKRAANLLQISNFDWRSKELICSQLQKIVNLLKAKSALAKFHEELEALKLDISLDKLTIRHLPNFILELQAFVDAGKLLKKLTTQTNHDILPNLIDRYIELGNIDNTIYLLEKSNEILELFDRAEIFRQRLSISPNIRELLHKPSVNKLHDALLKAHESLLLLLKYLEADKNLDSIPNSKDKIIKLLEDSKFILTKPLENPELIVERHRLCRLYDNTVTEETTETVAQSLKRLESAKKELIYDYILNMRLKTLHTASKSRLANANLVKLKTLLGRKKKTLNFLKKKGSIDFSQVLYYFPCWLASIDDIARYFPLEKGLFDYVIVDEASQCSQTSIPHLFYRSKNAVIVGDEKQLPNANLRFLQKGIMDALQRKYELSTHEKSHFLDCKEFSLLTFAQAATPPQALIEHFRCDPTIITWSNKNVYNTMMKIMTPIWENRFNPPMEVRYIANGSEDVNERVNPVEANVVIEEIKSLVSDKANEGLTIGVISPFRPQADLISELIYKEINPEIIKRFALQSRTVDGFQGDERDIILYSMRFSTNGKPGSITAIEGGVNEEGFKRMNVAFTRARRKATIFTSQQPSLFPGKYIKSFMEHALIVQDTYTDPFQPKEDQFDSQFEEDVCRILRGRGINVITQFEVGGYRIDQVIFDKEGKTLAIECDGDFKFDDSGDLPPEHYMRQATIERITQWDVHRITASTFYLNPEEVIDKVIETLHKQPTTVERKFSQIIVEEKESATGLAMEKQTTEEDEVEQVLKVVESNPEVKSTVDDGKKKKPKDKDIIQTSLFEVNVDGIATNKDLWFKLAHWGKTSGNFSSFQNRFCYSLGMYISRKNKLTPKQEAYGQKLLKSALDKGFTFISDL